MSRRAGVLGVLATLVLALVAYAILRRGGAALGGDTARARGGVGRSADTGDADGVRARANDSAARRVRGRVVDPLGEPVEEGTISLRCLDDDDDVRALGPAIALDEGGTFEAPGCLGTVCAELHHTSLVRGQPWVLEPGEVAELQASALPRLTGTVEDRRGTPVAAAQVNFVPADREAEGILPVAGSSTTTDDDGVFAIALVRRAPCDPCTEASSGCDDAPMPWIDRIAVVAVAPRFAPARVELDVDPDRPEPDPITIRVAPPADTLSGVLTDASGAPYPRAQVLARSRARPSEHHFAVPDGESFAFEALGDGAYDLRALQDGVELATREGVLAGEDVELRGARSAIGPDLVVEVIAQGRPQLGALVDGGPFRGARTDMHGQVRAERAMPGDYVLLVRPRGGRGSRHPITIAPASPRARPPAPPTIARIEIELPPS